MEKLLQDIYNSEINIRIEWFWDWGFDLYIWDEMNWYKETPMKDNNHFSTLDELCNYLKVRLCELYPNSSFAKKYKITF